MKKLVFLILFISLFRPFHASAQDLNINEFRENLKKVYYFPQRDGMKGFRCYVESSLLDNLTDGNGKKGDLLSDLFKIPFKVPFVLEYDLKELKLSPEHFQPPPGLKTNPNIDQFYEMLNAAREIVEGEINFWAVVALPTQSQGKTDFSYHVKAVPDGYQVFMKDKTGHGIFNFGPDYKLNSVELKLKGKPAITVHTEYEKTGKGFIVRSCEWTYQNHDYKAAAEYFFKDDFFVPATIKITIKDSNSDGVIIFDKLQFSNYHIQW